MTIESDLKAALVDLMASANLGWGAKPLPEAFKAAEKALAAYESPDNWADDALIEEARCQYASDEIEIDDMEVKTSKGEGGTWVQAWVWIAEEDEDSEG